MKRVFSWSNKGHLGFAIEELTSKGSRRIVHYEKTQDDAVRACAKYNDVGYYSKDVPHKGKSL